MGDLIQELRFGVRALGKTPGMTAAAIVAFALGIGANAAIFSVVDAVLLRPLGYSDPARLVVLEHAGPSPVAPATYFDWRAQARSFTDMGAAQAWGGSLRTEERVKAISGLRVTANMLSLLGVQAMVGRTFRPDEDQPGHAQVILLSFPLWQREFGGRRDVLGRPLTIDGASYTIIGVMPPGFHFAPFWVTDAEVWAPLDLSARANDRTGQSLRIFARVKQGVPFAAASVEMNTIMSRLAAAYPDSSAKLTVSLTPLRDRAVGAVRPMLLVLLASVGFVLLIACSNVASLMLARGAARRRETAVRLALGARRWDIARQAIVESAILSGAGAIIGLFAAIAGISALRALLPEGALPRQEELSVDNAVFLFTAILALVSGLLSGVVPAWQSSRGDVNDALKQGGRTGTAGASALRSRGLLVASETAVAFVLLTGAGLMVHSFVRLLSVDAGFQPAHLLTMQVSVAGTNQNRAPRRALFYREAMDRVAALPGVSEVSAINHVPLRGDVWSTQFRVDGQPMPKPGEFPNAIYRVIEPGYFHVMQTPLLRGRDFNDHDNLQSSRVAIVNEALARRWFADGTAVGKRIIAGRPGEGTIPVTVVGVVHNVKQSDWQALPDAEIYFPFLQSRDFLEDPSSYLASIWFVVRTSGEPSAMINSVDAAIHSIDRGVLISGATGMEDAIARSIWRQRLSLLLLGVFALVALALALTGIYGVVSHSAAQRIPEMGIRMALGAQRKNVLWLSIGHGMRPVWAGGLAGLLLALALSRLMSTMLFEVTPTDPLTLLIVAAILPLGGLLANWWPAWRASRIDPLQALRQE